MTDLSENAMAPTFGDGTKAPPLISRDVVELQRACAALAWLLKRKLPERLWTNFEADIAPNVARFVVHYAESPRSVSGVSKTLEIDLHPGLPVDRPDWLEAQASTLVDMIGRGDSDFILPLDIDYLRLTDANGCTIFERGKAAEFPRKR